MKRKSKYLLMAAVYMMCLWGGTSLAERKVETSVKQTVTPEDFGGYPSDGGDDTEAFRQALTSGSVVQLSKGTYEISGTLDLTDQMLIGTGSSATTLLACGEDKNQPILRLGGRCTVSDMVLQFRDGLIDYTEKEGDRVAIWLGNEVPADGSQLKNLRFINVGTAIYSANAENAGASRLLADTLFIPIYSYRGVDFQKVGQYGNTFSNLYIGGKDNLDYVRNAGFAVEGCEYNLVVEQLNLEHYYYDSALLLKNCYGARIGSVHMEANGISRAGAGAIRLENTDAFIDGITLYYNPIDYPGCSVVELGDAGSAGGNQLEIGTMHLKGLNNVNSSNHAPRYDGLSDSKTQGFKVISRTQGASGTYEVKVEAYVWYTWSGEEDIYKAFPCDETGIHYLSKGIR